MSATEHPVPGAPVDGAPIDRALVNDIGGRALRWQDGFVFSLTIPAALVATLGTSIAVLGGWGAVVLWTVSMLIAVLANWLYSELAAMFPTLRGGIGRYAEEAWRSRVPIAGPIATFGYWFAWSSSLAVYSEIIGSLVQAQWFAGTTWSVEALGARVGLGDVVAVGVLVAVWAANVSGLRPTLLLAWITAAMLAVPLAVFLVGTYLTGDFDVDRLGWHIGDAGQDWGGLKLAIVWLYVMGWTSFGVETCATFAPEYRDPVRDTSRALRAGALFSLVVFALLPLGAAGTLPEDRIAADPVTFYVPAFAEVVGGASDLMVVLLIGTMLLVVNTSMADSGRASAGISEAGLTLRAVGGLDRRGLPVRALTVDLVVNVALVLFARNILTILAAGNLGYLPAHLLALSGFLLLRHDRPAATRPIRLARPWLGAAIGLVALLGVLIVVGASSFELTGYGGRRELLIALGIIALSLVLYALRRFGPSGR